MSTLNDEILREALAQLDGWQGDRGGIHRTLDITESQHAELTERIKVVADAMRLRPDLHRTDGCTQIGLDPVDGDVLTTAQVALAARIEDAYRTIAGPFQAPPQRHSRVWFWRRGADDHSVSDTA
ncbi:hypothetical protein GCM10022220_15870 [Actinocatenispora rupis]|uniref:Putative pterin-4-alpha-carbinolamine dehydratase n=1 Tax=Actinocatenispora rupis TaxID=519421 RepID=A0A8J3N8M7_9ACTN|nr:hypothetical protein Aru02nite_13630 [Actinocatenispora rupis]